MEIYLDNAATTRVCEEAAEAALRVMTEQYGNPSSTHTMGRNAKVILEEARRNVAAPLGCSAQELFFTSCGTESDNWAIREGAHLKHRSGRHIISSAAEHDAVRRSLERLEAEGYEVTLLKPDETGAISVESVKEALRDDTILVSLMLVNNETGAITDIAGISRVLRAAGSPALLHTDAVQAYCKIPFTAKSLGADMISISGHKIHAPKGIGALYIHSSLRLQPFLPGGGQESGYRAGTEAIPAIAAFGEAAKIAKAKQKEAAESMTACRTLCVETLTELVPSVMFLPGGAPHILSLSLPGYRSEVLMNYLEAKGIYLSKSSACKKGKRSHVLEAMGIPERVIDGALRVSFSRYTTLDECRELCSALAAAAKELRASL